MEHPLVSMGAGGGARGVLGRRTSGSGIRLAFPEFRFRGREGPVTLLPDGTLFTLEAETGKYRWLLRTEGGLPVTPPTFTGPWITLLVASPPALCTVRDPDAPSSGRSPPEAGEDDLPRRPTFPPVPARVSGPEKGAWEAGLVAGRLVTVFAGQTLEAVETFTGRFLWRRPVGGATLAFTTAGEVWLSEPGGQLVARSARSGRERHRVELPERGNVIDVLRAPTLPADDAPSDPTTASSASDPLLCTLIVSQGSLAGLHAGNSRPVGAQLYAVGIDPKIEKRWEVPIHRGNAVYGGRALLGPDRSWTLAYNGESEAQKWYTRLVRVEPQEGKIQVLASLELKGRGTGQLPRVARVADGIVLGNADGFGFFASQEPAVAPD
jgi:hypothetical protein